MFDNPPMKGDYGPRVETHLSVDTVAQMIADYAGLIELIEEDSGLFSGIKDMRVTRAVTGYGSHTSHHLDDSDYIVYFDVMYADRDTWNECVYGVHNGQISLWLN